VNPIKAAITAFIVSMGGFLAYHLLSSGGSSEFQGLQNLGYVATPISAIVAGVIFIVVCVYKVASRSQ
jgi:hypothetical protein